MVVVVVVVVLVVVVLVVVGEAGKCIFRKIKNGNKRTKQNKENEGRRKK